MRNVFIYADNTFVSGPIFNSSDSRLKTDVVEIKNSLEKLKRLNVVTYKWKDKGMGEDPQIGVIAQDVEAVFPELVKETANPLFAIRGEGRCDAENQVGGLRQIVGNCPSGCKRIKPQGGQT